MNLRDVIFGLAQAYREHIKQAVNANELGLNGMHVRCLHVIAKQQNCTANTIVNFMGKDKAQIARLIKDMLAKGWVEKQANEEDKRSQILTLSKSGKALQQHISILEQSIESKMFNGLNEQDQKDFIRITKLMLDNVKA